MNWVKHQGGSVPDELRAIVEDISNAGGTPLVVARDKDILGLSILRTSSRAA